jgi:hypothetical protein
MMPAPPAGEPSVLSKYLTLDYSYSVCTKAFPPGQVYTLPQRPNYVDKINSRGGYDIAADRLMLIGGEWDPWRPVTPLADTATPRLSTDLRPVRVAPDSSHCSDINNWHASGGERDITQDFELEHVTKWIEQWNAAHNGGITPGASVPAAPVSSAESAEPTPTASQSQSQSQSQAQSESSVPSVWSTVTAPSSAASPSSTPGKNGNGVGHGYGNVGGNGKGNNGNGNGNGGNNGKGHANRKRRIAKDA